MIDNGKPARPRIAFIGAGRMASAMVEGILRRKICQPADITCTCGNDPTGPDLAARTGIGYEPEATRIASLGDILILACKPQQFNDLDDSLTAQTRGKLIISILAGTPLARLQAKFSQARNIIRAMPNTPGQIGAGVTGWAALTPPPEDDSLLIQDILASLGKVITVEEKDLDALTAVSGSGPAYLFEFTAALREAAEKVGLSPQTAHTLALETIIGSALLMKESGTDPVELRKAVTSPGGTTQAALESFQKDDLRASVTRAVQAATQRSIELAKL